METNHETDINRYISRFVSDIDAEKSLLFFFFQS